MKSFIQITLLKKWKWNYFLIYQKEGEGERIYILFGTEGNGGRGEERRGEDS